MTIKCFTLGGAFFLLAVSHALGQVQTRDSAGVVITDVQRPPRPARISLGGNPIVEIGDQLGVGSTDFGSAIRAWLIADDIVAVVDQAGREIRLFDGQTGRHIRNLGRAGRGPGEFESPPILGESEDGGLWAFDRVNARLSLFGPDGSLRFERPYTPREVEGLPYMFPLWIGMSGIVAVFKEVPHFETAGIRREGTITLIVPDSPAPVPVGPTTVRVDARTGQLGIANPFRSLPKAVTLAGDVIVSETDSWQLAIFDVNGKLHRILRCAIPRTAITRDVRARERQFLQEHAGSSARRFLELFDHIEFGDSTSAIANLWASPDGMIWVSRWRSADFQGEQTIDAVSIEGQWLGTLRVPARAGRVTHIRNNRVLTVWHDSLDVPYIRVYELRRESG